MSVDGMGEYQFVSKIGEGSFSKVFKVQHKKTKKTYAVKVIRDRYRSLEQVQRCDEIQVMLQIGRHPNIIGLHEVVFEPVNTRLSLVLDLMDMNLLDGSLSLNGAYNTSTPDIPSVKLDLNAKDLDVQSAYNAFSLIRESLPIAVNCSGKISARADFSANLDRQMSPVMTTANGSGTLSANNFLINDNPTLNKLSTLLKNNELSRLSISKLKIDFAIANGDITVKPFTVDLANIPTTIQGTQSVNGELNYTLSMNVDKKYFGNDINNVLKTISGSDNIKALDVDVKIGGTLDKPTVTPDLSKALKTIQKEAGKNLKDNLLKGLNKLFK